MPFVLFTINHTRKRAVQAWAARLVLALGWAGASIYASAQQKAATLPQPTAVAETVRSILAYARWPDETRPLRLCVTGHSLHAETLLSQGMSPLPQREVVVQRVPAQADALEPCDALYAGGVDEASWRKLLARLAGRPVLTLCERSPICAIGGMFCLDVEATVSGVTFEVNLDSVARSGVRVNPQVLRLGRRTARSGS